MSIKWKGPSLVVVEAWYHRAIIIEFPWRSPLGDWAGNAEIINNYDVFGNSKFKCIATFEFIATSPGYNELNTLERWLTIPTATRSISTYQISISQRRQMILISLRKKIVKVEYQEHISSKLRRMMYHFNMLEWKLSSVHKLTWNFSLIISAHSKIWLPLLSTIPLSIIHREPGNVI